MKTNFEVALDIADAPNRQSVLACLGEMDGVAVNSDARLETLSDEATQLLICHIPTRSAQRIEALAALRRRLPQLTLFVISPDKSPGHIVEVMKAGADEFFPNPIDIALLRAAIVKVRQCLAGLFAGGNGTLYSFISAKGGLGATVVSVNAAAALAQGRKESVALLDMCLQSGDSSVYLDTLPHTTLADICRNFHRLDFSFLKTSMLQHATGLHYLAAPTEPEDSGTVQGSHIRRILQLAKSLYDRVVVDCSSMLIDDCSLEIFQASDRIFLLTDLSVPALRNAARLDQLLQKLDIPSGHIEIVVNRFSKGGASLQDVEQGLRKKIFWFFPNDFDDVILSINDGVPLVKSKPRAPFARNMFEFVEKLKAPDAPGGYRGAKGRLGKAI